MRVMAGACAKTGGVKDAARSVRMRLRSGNMIGLIAVWRFSATAPRLRKRDPFDAIKERRKCEWGASGFPGTEKRPPRPGSLTVADQHPVASRADLRAIGLQACQDAHRILQVGTAEFAHIGAAGCPFLRRALLHRQWRKRQWRQRRLRQGRHDPYGDDGGQHGDFSEHPWPLFEQDRNDVKWRPRLSARRRPYEPERTD